MTRRKLIHPRRDGVTLIELLVVASIMLTIAAVSVPSIKPMMESQATARGAGMYQSTFILRSVRKSYLRQVQWAFAWDRPILKDPGSVL